MNTQANPTQAATKTVQQGLPSADEVRAHRHMLAISAISGLTLGAVLFAAVELLDMWLSANFKGATGLQTECSADRPCPSPAVCSAGECITLGGGKGEPPPRCSPGDPCDGACACEDPMECKANICTPPELPPTACDDPQIRSLLATITEKCGPDFRTCPESDLEKYIIESDTFLEVLTKFPDTITVHFDDSTPPLRGKAWPPAAIADHYRAGLGTPRNRKALERATHVFLIGAASGSAKNKQNLYYARARANAVGDWIAKLGDSPSTRDALNKKVRPVNLGAKQPLTVDFYRERYRNSRVTWSSAADTNLSHGLKDYKSYDKLSRDWVDATINQVVFVIPINCDLPSVEARR